MKLPRDLSGADLVKRLARFGYSVTLQTGSHMRLTSITNGEHHITLPNHDPQAGNARRHSGWGAVHHGLPRDELIKQLFE